MHIQAVFLCEFLCAKDVAEYIVRNSPCNVAWQRAAQGVVVIAGNGTLQGGLEAALLLA